MKIPTQFLDEIIEEAKADEVGLWFLIGRIRDDLGTKEPESLQATTLQCVRELLYSGAVVAGYYGSDGKGVKVWDLKAECVVSRIEHAWNELGRTPDIGEIVVFVGSSGCDSA